MDFDSYRVPLRLLALAAAAATLGCSGKPIVAEERVAVPSSWRTITLGNLSFRFPERMDIPGHDDTCGGRSAPKVGCMVGIEGPVLRFRRGGLTLTSRDDHGDRGPEPSALGERVRLNETAVHRARLPDRTIRFTVTADSGGRGAATLLWYKPDDAMMWLTCATERACRTAKTIAASVRFESARDVCGRLEAARRRAAEAGDSPPPPPLPPASEACKRFG